MSRLADWFNSIFPNGDYLPNGRPLAAGAAIETPHRVIYDLWRSRLAPTREEWAAWRDDPTTKFAFAALRAVASEQKQAWDDFSWHGGRADQQALTEFRTRADTYESLEHGSYEQFCAWAGVEPDQLPAEDKEQGHA